MNTKRLFFALWPDNRQRDHLRNVINSVARTVEGRVIDRRNWHVTVSYIGDFAEARIPELLERANRIEVEPFHLGFDRLEYWARPKLACLVGATVPTELENLVASLNGVLQEFGVEPEDRTYRPHITVVRNARAFTAERLAHRETTAWASFELIESRAGPGGVSYVPLKQ